MGQGSTYNMDICFVIDATGSMGPFMTNVKERAKTLPREIAQRMKEAGKEVTQLRINVIDFADYADEGDEAIGYSDFFSLPEEEAEFRAAIDGLKYEDRGGDLPENALEALYYAMTSDWTPLSRSQKGRHIIVLITDADPLDLGERKGCIGYPDDLPANLEELHAVWDHEESLQGGDDGKGGKLSLRNRRLLLYVPDTPAWAPICQWKYALTTYVEPKKGIFDINIDTIINEIVLSAAD